MSAQLANHCDRVMIVVRVSAISFNKKNNLREGSNNFVLVVVLRIFSSRSDRLTHGSCCDVSLRSRPR